MGWIRKEKRTEKTRKEDREEDLEGYLASFPTDPDRAPSDDEGKASEDKRARRKLII